MIDSTFQKQVSNAFQLLKNTPASQPLPIVGQLADALIAIAPEKASPNQTVMATPIITRYFVTASVEMWRRSIHSFLVSAALTKVSPIWASVVGYYSSHYAIRAIAHLTGHFLLFKRKTVVELRLSPGGYTFEFKHGHRDPEHKFYWKTVKSQAQFAADPLFTNNVDDDQSDVAHRNRANYADHVYSGEPMEMLTAEVLKDRIRRIAGIDPRGLRIPSASRFPDVEMVQVVAYHRLVRYRSLVDAIVSPKLRCWSVWRNATWCADLIDFQIVSGESRIAAPERR